MLLDATKCDDYHSYSIVETYKSLHPVITIYRLLLTVESPGPLKASPTCTEMESNHRTRRNGFTVRRVWPLRYPCVLMTPSLRARAPPIYYERRTPRKRSCSTLLRRRARFKDSVRFELTNDFRRFWFSRPTPSATRPTIHSRWVQAHIYPS